MAQLILGLPWYGYDYPCVPDSTGQRMSPEGDACHLSAVPFRGAPCSDAAGRQVLPLVLVVLAVAVIQY